MNFDIQYIIILIEHIICDMLNVLLFFILQLKAIFWEKHTM